MQSPPTIDDLIVLNQEILAIARARVPVAPELVEAAREMPQGAAASARLIAHESEKGSPLDEAVATQRARLPAFYTSVVAAGVKSGRLPAALEDLSGALARMKTLRRQVVLALAYPLAIATLAWVLLILAAGYLAPQFDWIGFNHQPAINAFRFPPSVVWTVALSVPALLLAFVSLQWLFSSRVSRSFSTGLWLLDHLPGVGKVCRLTAYANFSEVLHLLIAHRTPLPEALRLAGDAVDWDRLRTPAGILASELERGAPLDPQSKSLGMLPPLVKLSLLANQGGDIPAQSLGHAAGAYHYRAVASLNNLALYLPAVATAAIGGTAVGVYALLVLGPYYTALWELAY